MAQGSVLVSREERQSENNLSRTWIGELSYELVNCSFNHIECDSPDSEGVRLGGG